jgi:hypothetical protein
MTENRRGISVQLTVSQVAFCLLNMNKNISKDIYDLYLAIAMYRGLSKEDAKNLSPILKGVYATSIAEHVLEAKASLEEVLEMSNINEAIEFCNNNKIPFGTISVYKTGKYYKA